MTEAEWLSCDDPGQLLAHLDNRIDARRAVLLGVACRRRMARWDYYPASAAATDAAERWAEGRGGLGVAYRAVYDAREAAGRMILGDPDGTDPHDGTAGYFAVEAAVALVGPANPPERAAAVLAACGEAVRFGDSSPGRTGLRAERRAQAELVRDIFGNPFRPVTIDPTWRTSTVLALATGIDADRAFDRLPILADALQDAGCDNPEMLDHCRGPDPHVRGCWVVDLLLGLA